MGSHPGTFNIDRDDEAMTIKGEAIVKIIKNIHYPFETGTYEPHEDGSVHYNAKLKSAFGNGTLDADFDIDKDGNISGGAKGILTELFSVVLSHALLPVIFDWQKKPC